MSSLKEKKLFLLDMDGTIYLDEELFDGTLDFLDYVRRIGGRYLFLTNNSSKGIDKYIEKLARLGIESVPEDFLTSTEATIAYLKGKGHKKIYAMGTASFCRQLRDAGLNVTESVEEGIDCLCISNDQELTFKKLEDVSYLLLKCDLDYIATNPDWVCPTAFGSVPDCGSFAEMLYRVSGKRPKFIGKPQPDMIYHALTRTGYEKDDALMLGDRLYTDIASGVNAGVDTVFVLSGEGTLADIEVSEEKPTYVRNNIRELYEELVK
jgi:HAD superfamily hydrolase (TIGR01450 family)